MSHYFEGARRFALNYCLFVTGEVNTSNYLIFFPRPETSNPNDSTPSQSLSFGTFCYSFIGAGVAIVAYKMHPSSPPPSLPAPVQIYGRDEFLQKAVDKILQQSQVKKHIAIRGAPGMGKTTSATGIIHHPSIARHFGKARHWVSCREASDVADDMKPQKLLEYISESLHIDLSGSVDRRKDIKYFLSNHNVPRIIVLDNFETMWEPPSVREASEGVLAFLSSFPQLTILLTTRNTHNPATHRGVSWHQFNAIQPLPLIASRMLFKSLCPSKIIDGRLDDLLHAVDYIPLPIVLMASYGQENFTTSKILDIWNSRLSQTNQIQPRALKSDGDPMYNLDLSIAMSTEGPLIKSIPEALVLLRIIASLSGAIRHENLPAIAPLIHDVGRVAAVLVRTSLITNSPDVWQMHSTIRSFMLRHYPLDISHQENIRSFYFQLIREAGQDPGSLDVPEHARRLSHEETNAQALLLDTLAHNFSAASVLISADYSNYLSWNIPSIDVAKKTVELIRNQPSATADLLLPLPLLRLGTLYLILDNYPKGIEALEEAVDRYERLDQLDGAAQAGNHLARIYRLLGEHTRAIQFYSLAYNRFKDVGDARGMSACLRGMGLVYFQENRYEDAVERTMKAQRTCSPDDHSCIADCERELGRVYRFRNSTESIRLSTKAREHHLIYGPQRYAAIALYQKSIALYLRGDYSEAEVGLKEAYEEFRFLRNDAQMAYSVYHLAEMHRRRGALHQALHQYDKSRTMFEHMGKELEDTGDSRMGNEFMVALSLECQVELYAKICQPDKAMQAYSSAHALLTNIEGRGKTDTHCRLDVQSIHVMCEIWRDAHCETQWVGKLHLKGGNVKKAMNKIVM